MATLGVGQTAETGLEANWPSGTGPTTWPAPNTAVFEHLLTVYGTGDSETVVDVGQRPSLVLEHERPVGEVEHRLDLCDEGRWVAT